MTKQHLGLATVGITIALVSASACGGKVEPPSGQGGASGSGSVDAGVSGGAGTSGSGGGRCKPLPGCDSSTRCSADCNVCTCHDGSWACTEVACADAGSPGCAGQSDPDKKYVSKDPKQCMLIDYACPPDSRHFTDDCGCGCEKVPTCGITECFRAVNCVTSCGGPVVQSGCCPCVVPAFDDILCSADGGACSCMPTTVTWGPDGGLVAYRDSSVLAPCRTYEHTRTSYDASIPSPSCKREASCDTAGTVAKLLANADVQAALKVAPVLYGGDPRPVDGTVLRVNVGGRIIDIGSRCATNCRAIPAGIEALRRGLLAIDEQYLGSGTCANFPR